MCVVGRRLFRVRLTFLLAMDDFRKTKNTLQPLDRGFRRHSYLQRVFDASTAFDTGVFLVTGIGRWPLSQTLRGRPSIRNIASNQADNGRCL